MKIYSDSTMKQWTKDALIERIRDLEHDCQALQEMNDNQFKILIELDKERKTNSDRMITYCPSAGGHERRAEANEEAIVCLVTIGNDLQMNSADPRGKAILEAISALENIDRITAERDAAIEELKHLNDNCFCCKWWNKNIKHLSKCQSPEPCCVDGNPDRWEWRGVQKECRNT